MTGSNSATTCAFFRPSQDTGRAPLGLIRLVNALRLGVAVIAHCLKQRPDVVMISTVPPMIGGAAAALGARLVGARFIYHCMDIHPEAAGVSGDFSRPAVVSALRKMDGWSCQRAEPVVVLSEDMRETLKRRPGGSGISVEVVNNFPLPSEDDARTPSPPFAFSPDRLGVLFAGNVGRFQGLEVVVDAMVQLRDRDDIEFVIMGEGIAKKGLKEKARNAGARVHFVGHQSVVTAKRAMREADLGFVSLLPDMYRYSYPSKTMTYLEQGCPLIVAVERQSELARTAESEGYGYWTEPGNADALANLLARLADHREDISTKRDAALRKAQSSFAVDTILQQWSGILGDHCNRVRH